MAALTERDTLKTPITAAPVPITISARQGATHWNREELFAAGALTIGELLANVPGATLMAAGFMLAPTVVAWHGDPGGIRVFLDGVEREEVTLRNGGITDFVLIPLWSLEDVTLEETAGELRVHLRTWHVERTTPATRTDVLTGSENLNLFRGYFGKRAANGAVIQLAAQQVSSSSIPGMDGDALGAMARVGWAGGAWSVDGTWLRQGIERTVGGRYLVPDVVDAGQAPDGLAVPAYSGATSLSYLRIGWRSAVDEGAWAQFVASTLGSTLKASKATGASATDSVDAAASQAQYTARAGINRGRVRLGLTTRLKSALGSTDVAPAGTAEFVDSTYALAATAGKRFSGASVWDVRGRVTPFTWLRLTATAGTSQRSGGAGTTSGTSVDASLRIRGIWIGGGVRRVDDGVVLGPVELDTTINAVTVPRGSAVTFNLVAPIWRGWMLQTDALRWDSATPYRPQTQVRSRVWFASSFSEKFPRANFHLHAEVNQEYRSRLFVPAGSDGLGQVAKAYSVFGSLLEIRIGSGVLSWSYRDMSGLNYATFPGFVMPKITSVYGLRWEFWN